MFHLPYIHTSFQVSVISSVTDLSALNGFGSFRCILRLQISPSRLRLRALCAWILCIRVLQVFLLYFFSLALSTAFSLPSSDCATSLVFILFSIFLMLPFSLYKFSSVKVCTKFAHFCVDAW